MLHFPTLTQRFYSPLSAEAIAQQVQQRTLPPLNDSWRDSFVVDPAQPFIGVVDTHRFVIRRLDVRPVRRAQPPLLTGTVTPAADNAGSVVCLRYSLPFMATFLLFFAGLMAVFFIVGMAASNRQNGYSFTGEVLLPLGRTDNYLCSDGSYRR